jgi:hypothetical protein
LTAALGINHIPTHLEGLAKGQEDPAAYFQIFSNEKVLGPDEHLWYKDNVVTMFDDHDMVSLPLPHKYRFAADKETKEFLAGAVFLNVFTLGIPCLYYGTEAGFDGWGDDDAYVRECMFAGDFGAFRTRGKHHFDENRPLFQSIARMLSLRKSHLTLVHGRQYLRPMAPDLEAPFALPVKIEGGRLEELVVWSRVHSGEEWVLGLSTHLSETLERYVCVDKVLHQPGDVFEVKMCSDPSLEGSTTEVVEKDSECCILLKIPAKGQIVLSRK